MPEVNGRKRSSNSMIGPVKIGKYSKSLTSHEPKKYIKSKKVKKNNKRK